MKNQSFSKRHKISTYEVILYDSSNSLIVSLRLDAMSSPLPGTISSVGTPESLSSADSPSFSFRPVDSPSPVRAAPNSDSDSLSDASNQSKPTDHIRVEQINQDNHR